MASMHSPAPVFSQRLDSAKVVWECSVQVAANAGAAGRAVLGSRTPTGAMGLVCELPLQRSSLNMKVDYNKDLAKGPYQAYILRGIYQGHR